MIPLKTFRLFSLSFFLFSWLLITSNVGAQEHRFHEACLSEPASTANEKGITYSENGEKEKALEEYLKAVKLDPKCASSYHNLGNGYYVLGRYAESIIAYQKALQFNHSWSWASVVSIGRAYAFLGRLDDAITAYDAVIQFHPNEYKVYMFRADVHMRQGKGELAAADAALYLKKGGWQDKNSPYMALVEYFGLRQAKQPEKTEQFLDLALSKVKKTEWPYPVLRYLRKEISEQDLLTLAKSDDGKMTEAHAYIGLDLSLSGRTADALEHLNWVKLNGQKNYIEYHFALAEIERIEKNKK